MNESQFHFKQFVIRQDKCAMKVGTDAVLLGSWVNAPVAGEILDIGTGTGVIAIMMAQKSNAMIDAIDIDENAYMQAVENVNESPWAHRINVHHISLQHFAPYHPEQYDLIISNPPYFVDASKPSAEGRVKARHTDDNLTFDELITGVCQMLKPEGRFCVILPHKEGLSFREKATARGLFCNEIMKVRTKVEKMEKRLMMLFELVEKPVFETELVVQEKDLSYTNEYIDLTSDFYIGLKKFHQVKKM